MTVLPPGWTEVPLGSVAETRLGKMLSKKSKTGVGSRPYLRNKNVQWGRFNLEDVAEMDFTNEEFDRFRLDPGDLLVCEGGVVGRAAIWRGAIDNCTYQKALHRVRTGEQILPEYLLYLFMHYHTSRVLKRFVTGSTIAHLPQEDLRTIPIPLPPAAEQRHIVDAIEEQFSHLDVAQTSLSRAKRLLRRLRASTLAAAVSGAIIGADARHWPKKRVADLAQEVRYGTSVKTAPDGAVPVLRMGNVVDGRLILRDFKYLPNTHREFPDLLLHPGDVLFNRTNSPDLVGKTAVYRGNPSPCSYASYLIRVRMRPGCEPDILAYFLNSPPGRDWARSVVSQQVGQANINGTKLGALEIRVPQEDQQRHIVEEVERHMSMADALEAALLRSVARAEMLRNAVLRDAFAGRLVPQVKYDRSGRNSLEVMEV